MLSELSDFIEWVRDGWEGSKSNGSWDGLMKKKFDYQAGHKSGELERRKCMGNNMEMVNENDGQFLFW